MKEAASMTASEKVAYLKGLAEGLGIDKEKGEGKVINAIIDVLEDLAYGLEDVEADPTISLTLRSSSSGMKTRMRMTAAVATMRTRTKNIQLSARLAMRSSHLTRMILKPVW